MNSDHFQNILNLSNELKIQVLEPKNPFNDIDLKNFGEIIIISKQQANIDAFYDKKKIDEKISNLTQSKFEFSDNEALKSTSISPIFMWCKDISSKRNQLIQDLKKTVDLKKILIIMLFQLDPSVKNFSHLTKFDDIYLKKELEPDDANPFITVFIEHEKLDSGKINRFIMIIAEHFNFNQFFIINDEIGNFYEFNGSDHVKESHTSAKTLAFMTKALNENIKYGKVANILDESDFKRIKFFIFPQFLLPFYSHEDGNLDRDFEELYGLILDKVKLNDQSEEALHLIEKLVIPKLDKKKKIKN